MRWWQKLLLGFGALVAVIVLGLWLFLTFSVHRAFPVIEGTVLIEGLDGTVEIVRDDMGIPHIYASSSNDLFLAQGYVHAQDRFYQMDFWRHVGAGRLSEMFGDSEVDTDIFLRTLGFTQVAEQELATMDTTSAAVLDAYTAGVNAYLADRTEGDLSFEYTILRFVNASYEPEPWTPVHSLTWGKVMAWDLGSNMRSEIDRAMLLGVLSPERVAQLYPPYPGDQNPYIIGDVAAASAQPGLRATPGITAALQRVAENADTLSTLMAGGDGTAIGSNSWVVSGDLTATGLPILANDPHLAIQLPSIWYQVGLHCIDRSAPCPYDVVGFSFAGVPGVIIGHNDTIAWGFTNLAPDVQDLYIEKINPGTLNQYEVNGEWEDMAVRTERIEVAGGDPVDIFVRETRHGPIVSGTFDPLDDFDDSGVDKPDAYEIALRWTALEPGFNIVRAFIDLDKASSWDEFREALRFFDVPAQNSVYADIEGNIGYQAPGRIPIRADGDGMLPVPGWTDQYEWLASIEFDDLPTIFNPEEGYIVTANNAAVDTTYPYLITNDWNRGYRARRLVDLLTSNPGLTLEEHGIVQFDTLNLNADRLVPFVLEATSAGLDGREVEARTVLADWDHRMDSDSAGAAIFAATWRAMLALTFHDELPEDQWPQGGSRWFQVMSEMVELPEDPFWDDITTDQREQRDDILRAAFEAGVEDVADLQGGGPAGWEWGAMHHATFENQSLGQSDVGLIDDRLNRGTFPASGGRDIVNATGWTATEGYFVDWISSMRMLVDLGDLSRSLTVHTPGQSGHTEHEHYDDMIELWIAGEYYPMRWTRSQVDEAAEGMLTLEPPES